VTGLPPPTPVRDSVEPESKESTRLDVRLLVPALVAWAVTATALSWPARRSLLVAALLVLVGVVCWGLKRPRMRRWSTAAAAACLATSLCLGALAAHLETRSAGLVPTLAAQRASAEIEAVVISDPKVIQAVGPRRAELVVVRLSVHVVVGRGQRSEPRTPVLVLGDEDWTRVRWHQTIRAKGRFGPAEPGDDVLAVFNPRGSPSVVSEPGMVARAAEHVRSGLRQAVDGLPADPRGLLPGLVIGDTSRTPPGLTDAMRDTGMTHLSAVSGSNVAVVLAAAMLVCGWCRIRRRWRPVVAGACLAGFVVLCRPEPSVLRAAVMGAIGLLGLSTSRRRMGLPALAAAVIVLLCVDPWLARSYGFALSTLATLGLLLFVRSWGAWFARFLPGRLHALGPVIAIPVAAQAMCAPVIVLLQGSVTVVGVLANLLAAPLVAPATVLGVLAALVALVSAPVAAGVAWLASIPTLGIAWIARACATVPMGQLPWPDGAAGAVLLAAVTLVLLFTGPWQVARIRCRPWLSAAGALLALACTWPTGSVGWPPPGWLLVMCDVGQGDGIVLASAPGHAVVVDTGPDPDAMGTCLRRLDVEVVDAVVLTHFHADHVDGLGAVLDGWPVGAVYVSPVDEPAGEARAVREQASEVGTPVHRAYAGDVLRWEGLRAAVLWPATELHTGSIPNNASVVLDVDLGGLRMLLLGDVEPEAARRVRLALEQEGRPARFDVLKVAHHGSAKQDPALLQLAHAPVALISVGADNDYGHPAPSALTVLRDDHFTVFRTDRSGDIAVSRAGNGGPAISTRGS
jgi:competence protein ComEC